MIKLKQNLHKDFKFIHRLGNRDDHKLFVELKTVIGMEKDNILKMVGL